MRSHLLDHWEEAMPADKKHHLLENWKAHRSCIDCKYWAEFEDERTVQHMNCCGSPGNKVDCASFMTPADYTCEEWKPL